MYIREEAGQVCHASLYQSDPPAQQPKKSISEPASSVRAMCHPAPCGRVQCGFRPQTLHPANLEFWPTSGVTGIRAESGDFGFRGTLTDAGDIGGIML